MSTTANAHSPKVVLVAVPLMARSGVYRSVHDLVRAATGAGLRWQALLGVRPSAAGTPINTSGVREFQFETHGFGSIREISRLVDEAPEVADADVVITMISQSDMAFRSARAREHKTWVAWVRGRPWPKRGEQALHRQLSLQMLETRALRQADDVWATTPVLAGEFAAARRAFIVPAGIAPIARTHFGENADGPLAWAGRLDKDKRPELFLDLVREVGHPGRIFGDGPLMDKLRKSSPNDVEWLGWAPADSLWQEASMFVGTSYREAFGRSAVEAAMAGLPVVIDAAYGAAPLLFTDPDIERVCVLKNGDLGDWVSAVRRLLDDAELRKAVAEHVNSNAQSLTIAASVKAATQRLLDQAR